MSSHRGMPAYVEDYDEKTGTVDWANRQVASTKKSKGHDSLQARRNGKGTRQVATPKKSKGHDSLQARRNRKGTRQVASPRKSKGHRDSRKPRSDKPKRNAKYLSNEQMQQREGKIRGPLLVPTVSHAQTWAGFDVQGYEPAIRSIENAELGWEHFGAQLRNLKKDVLALGGVACSATPGSEAGDPDDDDAVLHQKASAPSLETWFLDTEEDTPKRPETGRGNRWLTGLRELDAQEEEDFNTSDDELDILGKEIRASVNVASPLSKLLVDDPSHEENENVETDLYGGILKGAEDNTPPSSGIAIANAPPPRHRQQVTSDSEEQIGAMASFRDQVTQVLMEEVSEKPSTLASTVPKSDTPSSSEVLDSRFIHKSSFPSLPLSEETLADECRLPEGDCRWIFLGVPKTRGKSVTKCACLRYALNPIVSGTTCNCGHQACYHSSVIETEVEQPKFVAWNEIGEKTTRLAEVHESATAFQGQAADKQGDRSKLAQYIRENDFQGLFTPSYLPLFERLSRNERRSSTTEDERETGHLIDDEPLLPAPFYPSPKAESQPRRKRQPSPTPSIESLRSLVDSIFSLGSLSSASTAPGSDNAFQRVLAVLQTDAELKDLYVELTVRTSAVKFKRNLGILLKRFAVDLEHESSCYDEQRTAKFIRSRARKIAQRIVDAVYPSGSTIERDQTSTSLTKTRAESSEDSRTDEEPDEYLELERFVTNSRAFQNLRHNIRGFLGLELSRLLAELPFVDENRLAESEESINSGQNALSCGKFVWSMRNFHHKIRDFLFPEPPIPNGLKRVRWKCPCGETLYDDYEELKPGAAKRMEDYLRRSSYKRCAGETKSLSEGISNVWSSFRDITTLVTQWTGTLENNGKTTIVHTELRYYSDARTTRTPAHTSGEVFYLLLCHNSGIGAEVVKLRQPDICDVNNDQKLFSFLHEEYLTLRKRWWTWISLWTLQSIKFVRFELYENELVDVKKLDDVPPPTKDNEYRHGPPNPPELNPPLGSTLLMHLFKHPELAGTKKKCLQKIPRKLQNRLAVLDADDDAIGWGLQFIEGWSKKRLMYMTALTFGFSSVVVMVLVSILGHDVQNAGAIASFMLSFVTIGIATAQAAMHMN